MKKPKPLFVQVTILLSLMFLASCGGIFDSGTCKDGDNKVTKVEVSEEELKLTVSDTVYGPAAVLLHIKDSSGDFTPFETFLVEDGKKAKRFILITPIDLSDIFSTNTSDYEVWVICSN